MNLKIIKAQIGERRFLLASRHIQKNRKLLPLPDLSDRAARRKELNKDLKENLGDRFHLNIVFSDLISY